MKIKNILFYILIGFNMIMFSSAKLGGCRGTRYGCCPHSNVAKFDLLGTNCNRSSKILEDDRV